MITIIAGMSCAGKDTIQNYLLQKENMSRYRLSKESGVPMTTINYICSGKANIDKYKL